MNRQEAAPESRFFAGEILGDCVLRKLLRLREDREVWQVFDRRRQTPAVLKLLRKELMPPPGLTEFLRHTDCPRLVKVLGCREIGDLAAVELEYVAGGSLGRKLAREGRLPLAQAVRIMRDVLLALREAHRHGIVHRDVKPGNILLTAAGDAKLGDFGIARLKSRPEKGPRVFGTASAMSPEQTVDSTRADERSDIFSLASVVYEMLTGRPRFPRGDFAAALRGIRVSSPDRFREELAPYATCDLIFLLTRMAANRPAERPESAELILAELDAMKLPVFTAPAEK